MTSHPPYAQPQYGPPPRRKNTGLIIGLAAAGAAVVLLCIGGVVAVALAPDQPAAQEPAAVTTAPTTSAALAPAATTTAPKPTTAPSPTASAVKTVAMPKVTGKNAAVAYEQLTALGFTNIQLGSQDRDDTVVLWPANWTVTKQSTKAGAKVKTDGLVVLTCTKQS